MIALGFLLLASPAPGATDHPYPLVSVLTASREACSFGAKAEKVELGLLARGWKRFQPEAGSWLANYVSRNDFAGAGAVDATFSSYKSEVAGRVLLALVSRMEIKILGKGQTTFSCEIFDPAAVLTASPATIRKWARRPPTSLTGSGPNGRYLARWVPGLGRGASETTITYIAPSDAPDFAAARQGLAYSSISKSRTKR